jgi:hypothetical protein
VLAPLNPLRAALYFDTFFEKPWKELYRGALIAVPDMPASYLPHLIALKLPLLLLALGGAGLIAGFVATGRRGVALPRRASFLMVALAATVPVAVALVTRPALYNGIRQFLFIVPPIAVLGGLAAAWALRRAAGNRLALAALCAVLAAGLIVPVIGMARLHPYQYVYFNALAGGVRGAHGNYMLDYWGLAFKQAANALHAQLAADGEAKPADRRWIVAVCGPQPPAQAALGRDFRTTAEAAGADFALTLGAFYCRQLDAPLIAEIRRAGTSFARVYDIRGRNVTDLLTAPPP